jgi:hypothetical protein
MNPSLLELQRVLLRFNIKLSEIPDEQWRMICTKSKSNINSRELTKYLLGAARPLAITWAGNLWLVLSGWARAIEDMNSYCYEYVCRHRNGLIPFASTSDGNLVCTQDNDGPLAIIITENERLDWNEMLVELPYDLIYLLNGIIISDPQIVDFI